MFTKKVKNIKEPNYFVKKVHLYKEKNFHILLICKSNGEASLSITKLSNYQSYYSKKLILALLETHVWVDTV